MGMGLPKTLTGQYTKELGKMIYIMEREHLGMLGEMYIPEHSGKVWPMDMAYGSLLIMLHTKECGNLIFTKVREQKPGQMAPLL